MNSITSDAYEQPVAATENRLTPIHRALQAWIATLLVSATLALIAGLGGILIAGISQLEPNGIGHTGRVIGVVLTATLFPLLFFTAHAMDRLIDARRKIRRSEYEMTEGRAR